MAGFLAGCGSAGPTDAGGCTAQTRSVRDARVLVRADLDGDGRSDRLGVTGDSGPCPDALVARVGHGFATLALGRRHLVPSAVTLVQLPGRPGLLLSAREARPHGFQLHLYAYSGGRLGELRDARGEPVVPFVVTGARSTRVSTSCGRHTIVVERAVAHEPPGVVFAWDVRRTTLTVSGARVSGQHTVEVADNVLPADLAKRYPDVVHQVFFRDCAAATPLAQ